METRYLEEFIVLAKVNNYRMAAGQLGISSSALTKHILSLEKELSAPLFERTTRKVQLSPCGKLFLPTAQQVLNTLKKGTTQVQKQQEQINNTLVIGTISISSQQKINEAIYKYKSERMSCSIRIIEDHAEHLKQMLRDGECDLIFLRQESDSCSLLDEFHYQVYQSEPLVAVFPIGHPLSGRPYVSLEQLKDEDFIFFSEGSPSYKIALNACYQAGFEPHIVLTNGSLINCIHLVSENIGIALLTTDLQNLTNRVYVSYSEVIPSHTTQIRIFYSKDETQCSQAARKFLSYINENRL